MAVINGNHAGVTDSTHSDQQRDPAAEAAGGEVLPSRYFRFKFALDRLIAVLLIVPALALIGVIAILVRLTSPGPGIYRQARSGKDGRTFVMYKIRTMRQDAEACTGAVWCVPGDARITPIGYWLRRLHLDELPQLINVLRGEMSLVGPRPERPEIVAVLEQLVPGYRQRLAVLPGVTGLAQANLPPDTDLESVRRKIVLDAEYIRTATLWMDVRLVMYTLTRMFAIPGSLTLKALGLYRRVPVVSQPADYWPEGHPQPIAQAAGHVNGNGHAKHGSDTASVAGIPVMVSCHAFSAQEGPSQPL